ncbi:MAG TPA: pitrilysin family protein, partial [Candidatus Deferrimicrobium sp.]
AHFIEHMLFKGTARREALDISREIESVGGTINACTEREYVFFFAKVLAKDFPLAVDILSDIYLNSLFDGKELERERDVVLQEILMVEDNPEDFLDDFFHESYWAGHPLGLPIQGTSGSVSAFTRDRVTSWFGDRFRRRGLIVSVVGNLEHALVVDTFDRHLRSLRLGDRRLPDAPPPPARGVFLRERRIEQVHICLGAPAVPRNSDLKYPAHVLNTILGGSMCSRLFQEVREKRGLAYAIASSMSLYSDSGIIKISAGASRDKVRDVLAVVADVVEEMRRGLIGDEEVAMARELIKGSMILGLESAEYRMSRLAMNELLFGRIEGHDESLRRVDAVTPEKVRELAAALLRRDAFSLAAVGDLPGGAAIAF